MDLDRLTAATILEKKVFKELFEEEDELERVYLINKLSDKAKSLGVKAKFDNILKVFMKIRREYEILQKKEQKPMTAIENWTNFDGEYDRMFCGSWIATENGIYGNTSDKGEVLACYHPVLPVERMKNLETGDEQMKLAYKRNGYWREIIVPKDIAASASKITVLSRQGIAVTSETAKFLVRYLADVENYNDNVIPVKSSTSKLGWIGDQFMPYDTDIIFDSNSRFRDVFESVHEKGCYEEWLYEIKKIRKSGRIEPKFMMAASFASVIVGLIGGLPFFTNLWGLTEGGKTVTLMLAASIWANPSENKYIGDFKTTDVALETKNDFLNNLPLILDDTSRVSSKIKDNFEGLIYDMCSGKGKSRSNKDLGINRENRWNNTILTTGERPLASDSLQGGAINRVLDLECDEKAIFEDVQQTLKVIKRNYGFAGKKFVQIIQQLGKEEIQGMQTESLKQIYEDEKMQKQSIALSIILTADKIVTDYIFKDNEYIPIDEAKKVLVDRSALSDNERCYQYILGEVSINSAKFNPNIAAVENWGMIEKGYVIIQNNAFDRICQGGGYSKKAFLSWADKKGLLQTQAGNTSKVKKINGAPYRCIFLKLEDESEEKAASGDGFIEISEQEVLPFT